MEKPIVFKNKKGKQLIGILHLPKSKGKFPLVIICHGFGGSKTRKKFTRLARALEKKKIACFRFDFEGCGDSEGRLETATIRNEVQDLNSALNFISKQKNINKNKIGFVAESIGAVIITLYIVQTKIKLKTLVFWAPAFNQKDLIPIWQTKKELKKWKEKGYRIHKDKKIGVSYLKENENKDYSTFLLEISVPILIIHGKKDETVPLRFSKKLAKDYKNIKLKIYPKTDHKFKDYYIQNKLVKETVNWFRKYF